MTPHTSDVAGDSADQIRVECQYGEETPPSFAIIRAIAGIENVDPTDPPTDFEFILHDHVDPEALDQLAVADGTETDVNIELTIRTGSQYAVQIRDDGHLVVEKGEETSESRSRADSAVSSVSSGWIVSRLRYLAGNIYD